MQLRKVDAFGITGLRRSNLIPASDFGGCVIVFGSERLHRREHRCPVGQERRAEVDVIEQLRGRGSRELVAHFVDDFDRRGAGGEHGTAPQSQTLEEQLRLDDFAAQFHLAAGGVDVDAQAMCRQVRDPAVQRVTHAAIRTAVRGAVAFQPAAHHEFIEAFEPAEPIGIGQRHQRRMNRPIDRRLPAVLRARRGDLPNPHASSRQHHRRRCAGLDKANFYPGRFAAGQHAVRDADAPALGAILAGDAGIIEQPQVDRGGIVQTEQWRGGGHGGGAREGARGMIC